MCFRSQGTEGNLGRCSAFCLALKQEDPGEGGEGNQRVAPFLGGESEQDGAGVHNTILAI